MTHDDTRRPISPAAERGLRDTKSGITARQLLKSPAKRPFDMWLEKQLHTMFEVGSEPGAT